MFSIDQVKEKLKDTFEWIEGVDFAMVSTKDYDLTTDYHGRNRMRDRSMWADAVVEQLFQTKRYELINRDIQFSYLKFAENADGVFAVAHGKSSFHHRYPSDVWFFSFDDKTKQSLKKHFEVNDLKWHKNRVLLVFNRDPSCASEALQNEKAMKKLLNTFD